MASQQTSFNPLGRERTTTSTIYKTHQGSAATVDTSVMTVGDSDSSISSCDDNGAYGYGNGSPEVAAKYGYEQTSPKAAANYEPVFRPMPSSAPKFSKDSLSMGYRAAPSIAAPGSSSGAGRSRRASIQFGGSIAPAATGFDTLESDFLRALQEESKDNAAGAAVAEEKQDDILSSLFAKNIHKPPRRRSSMPFAMSSGAEADTEPVLGVGGSGGRSQLGNDDPLGKALANDAINGIDFASERQPAAPRAVTYRRSSMPFLSTSAAPPAMDQAGGSMRNLYSPPAPRANDPASMHHYSEFAPPMPQMVYNIKFKRDTKYAVLGPRLRSRDLPIGTYVKVEADRGQDLGIVVSKVPLHEYRPEREQDHVPGLKKVTCLANQDEVSHLPVMRQEEARLLQMCRRMVWQMGLPMTVIDAEYQFDKNKLTFYYESETRVDFRDLVRWLYSVCGTRIWMCQTFSHSPRMGYQQQQACAGEPEDMHHATPIIAPESEWAY